MRRFIQVSFALWFATSMTLAQVCIAAAQTGPPYPGSATDESSDSSTSGGSHFGTSTYTPEQSESRALTDYLKQHRLPLVGAQVLQGADGQRMVVLYGFVGSDFGKTDAATKTRRFLQDSDIRVDNRINVNPELLTSNRPSSADAGNNSSSGYPPAAGYAANPQASPSPDDASSYPGPDSYKAQQASPYAQQFSSMMPLIALLGVLGMSAVGGRTGFSFGSSPFGTQSYGSPYASPFGQFAPPSGGSPFGASPYGSAPYGNSPYSSPPYGGSPYGSIPFPPHP